MKRCALLGGALLSAVPIVALWSTRIALADEGSEAADHVAEAIADVAPADLVDVASTTGAMVADGDRITVEIPQEPETGVGVSTAAGDRIVLGLPGAVRADDASLAEDGTAVYSDALPSTDIAVQAVEGDVVRALLVIESPAAPTEFRFPITVPNGGGIAMNPDGSAEIWNSVGLTIALVAPPWATDAAGQAIATHFRLDGATLVQVVEHRASSAAYPVVADPSAQFDCGYVTCTLRFNRTWTRNIRDGSWVAAGFMGVCTAVTAGVGAIVCAVVAARLVIDAVLAGRFYENGNCIKYKIYFDFGGVTPIPQELKRGTYNCV